MDKDIEYELKYILVIIKICFEIYINSRLIYIYTYDNLFINLK